MKGKRFQPYPRAKRTRWDAQPSLPRGAIPKTFEMCEKPDEKKLAAVRWLEELASGCEKKEELIAHIVKKIEANLEKAREVLIINTNVDCDVNYFSILRHDDGGMSIHCGNCGYNPMICTMIKYGISRNFTDEDIVVFLRHEERGFLQHSAVVKIGTKEEFKKKNKQN